MLSRSGKRRLKRAYEWGEMNASVMYRNRDKKSIIMINKGNIFDIIDQIGTDKLPAELLEAYGFLKEISENGSDWEKNTKDIEQHLHAILQKFNEWYKKYTESIAVKETETTTSTDITNVQNEDEIKAEKWINPKKNLTQKTKQKATTPKPRKVTPKAKKVTPKPKKVTPKAKKSMPKAKNGNVTKVTRISPEVQHIRKALGYHERRRPTKSLLAVAKALQRDITNRVITRKSPHLKEIELLQEYLVKAYNKATTPEVELSYPPKVVARWANIAGGEEVYGSITLLRRFVALKGKEIKPEAAQKLYYQMKDYKPCDTDPYVYQLQQAEKTLKSYKKGKLILTEAQLSGLEGIGCAERKPAKKKKGLGNIPGMPILTPAMTPIPTLTPSPTNTPVPAGPQPVPAQAPVPTPSNRPPSAPPYRELPLTPRLKNRWGRIVSDNLLMLHGLPGSGKTHATLEDAKELADIGLETLYVPNEELGRSTFDEKLEKTGLKDGYKGLTFMKQIPKNLKKYDAIILDSVNSLGMNLKDFKQFANENQGKLIIILVQSTKEGGFRGGNDWEHEVDIHGKQMEDRNLYFLKHRPMPEMQKKYYEYLDNQKLNDVTKRIQIRNEAKAKAQETKQPTLTDK